MAHPLSVALVWHQHQPDYRDPRGGPALLPWARLHATKDYMHMAELVADFPSIHCTFNFVPSLVDQLAGIGQGRIVDAWQALCLKPVWTPDDKQFLRDHFFSIHPRVLERYPAYGRLRDRRDRPDLPDQYWIDLAVWFNLAWIDARAIARDETLRALVAQGEGYTRADLRAILAKHCELAARVLPFHAQLAAQGQIELSTSPYYHPILPLLMDQRLAREAIPNITLPARPFAHAEDAAEHLRRSVAAHRQYFGHTPHGLWPSEGSVCDDLLALLGGEFRWVASDENVLARSLGVWIGRDPEGHVTNPRVLYQPYTVLPPATYPANRRRPPVALVFRDHLLSDRIGFAYQYQPARDAAGDLIGRLHRIRQGIADVEHGYLVSIILDGENAWESYEDNGDPFFRELYAALANDPELRTVTVSEYLSANPPRMSIRRLAAGSWINGNFDTWIGEPAQNRAWDLVAQTRAALAPWQRDFAGADEAVIAHAWDEVYIAEGSDWFWWYSSHNNSAENALFDELFRGHLQNVYMIMGRPVPAELKEPILKTAPSRNERGVTAPVTPALTAAEIAGGEWNGAGVVEPAASIGTMQQAETRMERLYYGYNADDLVLRIEARVDLADYRIILYVSSPHGNHDNARPRGAEFDARLALTWELAIESGQTNLQLSSADGQDVWKPAPATGCAVVNNRVVEMRVGRRDLALEPGDTIGLVAVLARSGRPVELLPAAGLTICVLNDEAPS